MQKKFTQITFFNATADDPINYGAIGAIIGHEITHGFDDQGRKFDKNGNLTDWWTEQDGSNFNNSTKMLAGEYDKFEALPSLRSSPVTGYTGRRRRGRSSGRKRNPEGKIAYINRCDGISCGNG